MELFIFQLIEEGFLSVEKLYFWHFLGILLFLEIINISQ